MRFKGAIGRYRAPGGTAVIPPTPPPGSPKVLAEGDSITAFTTGDGADSFSRLWHAQYPAVTYQNNAVGGAQTGSPGDVPPTNTLYARLAGDLAYAPTIACILIGANDASAPAATYLANLYGYTDALRATGTKIIMETILPRMVGGQSSVLSGFEALRGPINAQLRTDKGVKFDDLVDFDTTIMGVAGSELDPSLYFSTGIPGVHPTTTGHPLLLRAYRPVLNHWLSIANEPLDFAFAPQAAATVDTDYDSANYTVAGLYAGETRPYSVQTGQKVSKNGGAFTLNGSGTVVNGDTLKVRNHSSVSAATQTDVTLTIGATTATYSVTTAGSGSRLWIPTDLGAKLHAWHRAEDIPGANGADIATWIDASGNSRTATGAGSGGNPTVVAASLNGFKTVRIDGAKQSIFTLPAGYLTGKTSFSAFVISKNVVDPNTTYFAPPLGDYGTDASGEFYPYVNGSVYSSFCTNARYQTVDPSPSLASWRFASFHSATNDWRYYIDGVAIHTLTSSTFAVGSSPVIGYSAGASSQFDGWIAEFVECNTALTTTERQLLEGYGAWKFGLQANLPGGHPYAGAAPTI